MTLMLIATTLLCGSGFLLMPRLRRSVAGTRGRTRPRVSLIIPARDEARNLPILLESLTGQSLRPHEVIVIDDGSTDATADIARHSGARVIPSQPLPEGWRGKTWACHQGAAAATGDVFCFIDADTFLDSPDGWENLLDAWPGGAFSICPWHAVERPYEHLSLFFNLNMVLGTAPDGLFGQLLLIDRASYAKVGGHERVRDKVLENFRLAGHCRELEIPVRSATGRGMVSLRMYPGGLRDLIEGWTKGFASGAGRTPGPVMALIIAWLTGLMLAPAGLAMSGAAPEWILLYGLCAAQIAWFSHRVGSFRGWAAPLYPLALVFFFGLFAHSARRSGRAVTWKGREIRAD